MEMRIDDLNTALPKTSNDKMPKAAMQLRRLTLFSSGVGFFEYSGIIEGPTQLTLPFNKDAVNDALKSMLINDPEASPTVSYHSEQTLLRTLKGLAIDLYGNHHIADLLASLKGAEIEVFTPKPLKGRIMLVEYRYGQKERLYEITEREAFLSLLTSEGISIISLKEISGFTFSDPKICADAGRALDFILQSRDSEIRNLTVTLPGQKSRKVSLSYVIPMPIWKVSYRLDLSREKPFLQGWAIVDNDSDTDWEELELALVTGKPVSFIQNLYAPYHVSRPTLPLSIAGIAEATTYESGTPQPQLKATPAFLTARSCEEPDFVEDTVFVTGGVIDTAQGRAAGDQFEFTIKNPVNLARQQSAMFPLVQGAVDAKKMLVFSGSKASPEQPMNPAVGTELVNNTGMKLPAGPITVYDGGTYAGDALISFFPEGEKRIIAYGEDLSVSGSFTDSTCRTTSTASVSGGVMVIKQQRTRERVYKFRNAAADTKRLIVEHPFYTSSAALATPSSYMEKTSGLYRFELTLPPGELNFEVQEEEPLFTKVVLSELSFSEFVGWSSEQELPTFVRAGLRRAVELKQKTAAEKEQLTDLQNRLNRLFKEQERTRKNLEVTGSQTQQGQDYLSRLVAQENDIDVVHAALAVAEQAEKAAQQAYDTYIRELCLDGNI